MTKNLLLFTLLATACGSANGSKLDEPSKNVAIETIHYVIPDVKCEEAFREKGMHSARCTLGDGTKIYCAAGGGWSCTALYDPREAAKAQAAQQGSAVAAPATTPTSPPPSAQPTMAPAPHAPRK